MAAIGKFSLRKAQVALVPVTRSHQYGEGAALHTDREGRDQTNGTSRPTYHVRSMIALSERLLAIVISRENFSLLTEE